MDNKILSLLASFFFSTRLMAVLFIGFAAAMGIGTFIENEYNTDTARIWVYNAWWFEAIMFFFMVNFFGNIKRYQLYKREKWATLLLHLSFILVLAGAFITRYISYEGMMPIREGEASNQVYSDKTYLTIFVDGEYKGEMKRKIHDESLLLSPVTDNDFSITGKFDQIPYEIEYKDFIMGATENIKEDPNGIDYLKMVESGGGTRHEHYLKSGEVQNIHNVLFALNKYTAGAININTQGKTYSIQAPFEGNFMRMADKFQGSVLKDSVQPLMMRSLYNLGGAQFVFPDPAIKGKVGFVSNNDFKDKETDDALLITLKAEGQEKEVTLIGSKGKMGVPQSFQLGKLEFTVFYGSKVYELPFKVQLNDFIASKYPGTEKSYSAFESQVTVQDGNEVFDYRIFMNNVLDHKGYRFFQASFDPDEKGTILSVNHDFWGTWVTYIGYFLLYFAMMAILFDKHTRFADIKRKLEKVKQKKAKFITLLVLFFSFGGFAQNHDQHTTQGRQEAEKFIETHVADPAHAAKFGKLVIQDAGGRMKPVNTFSSELLRKVSKSDQYKGMNSDQVFLSMTQYPRAWFEIPLIYIKKGNDSIRKIIGVANDQKLVPFRSFFDAEGNYKLSAYLDAAYKNPVPNQFQKDFIETDRKVNLLNSALSGSILKIFPIPSDPNNKWVSHMELHAAGLKGQDTITSQVLPAYVMAVDSARTSKNYASADFLLEGIHNFQKKYGSGVLPSDEKIRSEIAYNKYDIFKKLYYFYMLAGVLMLLFTIVNIFFEKKILRIVINVFHVLIVLLFVVHTLGLIARWYISGHAPWSDAYESMIYVAWATMLFTLLFSTKLAFLTKINLTFYFLSLFSWESKYKSPLVVASGTFVASMILMIAHWSWMDPSIANLQPVLNSYWLMIHVAVIVASYGPFTLAMILGVVALILMLFTNEKNKAKMKLNIQEITYINEMALTIGLVMLTIGNFLGGQWANESWGRYWGWDPKETWALISIMVYAFVIHARFVPIFRGLWVYNLMSIIAFYSIMMTYFGVNFYLSGLHSYASGDQVVTPVEFYYSLVILTILAAFAWFRYKKHLKKKKD